MTCPTCGADNVEGSEFCSNCGTGLTEVTSTEPPSAGETTTLAAPVVPEPIDRGPGVSALAQGWMRAAALGSGVWLAMVVLAMALTVLVSSGSDVRVIDVARGGGVMFFLFHHVGIGLDTPPLEFPLAAGAEPRAVDLSLSVEIAFMGATLLAIWLLARAARSVAKAAGGGPWWVQALNGMKVAIPYAVLSTGLAALVRFQEVLPPLPFAPRGGELDIGPSAISALVWTFAIAGVAGLFGGLRNARQDMDPGRLGVRALAVLAGGRRMAVAGMLLSVAGLLILAALNPDAPFLPFTRPYFDALGNADTRVAALIVIFTVLLLPNLATWILIPAMGGALGAYSSPRSLEFLSYAKFPTGIAGSVDPGQAVGGIGPQLESQVAPIGFFLFLLVPLLATLWGGRAAARRGGAESRGEAVALGAAAGVVYAAMVAGLGALAVIGAAATGGVAIIDVTQRVAIGPSLGIGVLLALIWGVVGGALGGLLAPPAIRHRAAPAAAHATGFDAAPSPVEPE